MRQRKIKNLEKKYIKYEDLIVYNPISFKGKWRELGKGKPVYLEIGCGKGKFISEIAEREPGNFFIAIEGHRSVMLRALEKIDEKGLTNVIFIPKFVESLTEWFDNAEISGIYLNFSDPMPKNCWYKRRLTYREGLKTYFEVLENRGNVQFKTDNTELFEWTIREIEAADLKIIDITRDLHADEDIYNIETEYEEKFSGLGEKIKRVIIERRVSKETEKEDMSITSIAAYNGRNIPNEDKVFAASGRAKALIEEKGEDAVINATIGSLLDDSGKLVVMKSVEKIGRASCRERV